MNQFLPISLLHWPDSVSVPRNWEEEGVGGLSLVSSDTRVLFVAFPASSIAALWVSTFLGFPGCISIWRDEGTKVSSHYSCSSPLSVLQLCVSSGVTASVSLRFKWNPAYTQVTINAIEHLSSVDKILSGFFIVILSSNKSVCKSDCVFSELRPACRKLDFHAESHSILQAKCASRQL